ncbi:MAG TPA: FGGY family carbohydrate kinase, partial [Gemmatales bacterium]|nr:FGGY family carbohydrate kinase [Gemmatales bacterium]
MYFLGLDIGTQSVRAVIFDAEGNRLGMGVTPVATSYPQPAWAEQQPGDWWQSLCQSVPQA